MPCCSYNQFGKLDVESNGIRSGEELSREDTMESLESMNVNKSGLYLIRQHFSIIVLTNQETNWHFTTRSETVHK